MISFHFNHNFLLADESNVHQPDGRRPLLFLANDGRDHGGDQRLTLCMPASG
jgi:hypothetical protein